MFPKKHDRAASGVDRHLYFPLQADTKELAFLEIHFKVLNMYLFLQMNRSRRRKTTSENVCVCVCEMVDGRVLALTCRAASCKGLF